MIFFFADRKMFLTRTVSCALQNVKVTKIKFIPEGECKDGFFCRFFKLIFRVNVDSNQSN